MVLTLRLSRFAATVTLVFASGSWAGDDTAKAAMGGALGGAAGAAIGEELGDRDGAIIGGAIGGAVGAAIATDDDDSVKVNESVRAAIIVPSDHVGQHCPPGQAKKGRC